MLEMEIAKPLCGKKKSARTAGAFPNIAQISAILLITLIPAYANAEKVNVGGLPGCDIDLMENILESIPPISDHYTKRVLDRAQAQIDFSKDAQNSNTFDEKGFFSWLEYGFEAFRVITDTNLRIIQKERDLAENSTCLHIDLFLIETMMEKARCELMSAFDAKRFESIMILKDSIQFLNERYAHLIKGARDNTFEDETWWRKRMSDPDGSIFDPIKTECSSTSDCEEGMECIMGFCSECVNNGNCGENQICENGRCKPAKVCADNENCPEGYECVKSEKELSGKCEKEKLCPFHSDYLSPSETGMELEQGAVTQPKVMTYGCTLGALEPYSSIDIENVPIGGVIGKEYEKFKELMDDRNAFIADSNSIIEQARNLQRWTGGTFTAEEEERLKYFGLNASGEAGHLERIGCTNEDGQKGTRPPDLPQPQYRTEEEEWDDPEEFEGFWPPKWPDGALRWETYGPFSIDKNELKLMREYMLLRESWGKNRPLFHTLPKQYGLLYFFQMWIRSQFKLQDIRQERLASTMEARAHDMQKQISDSLKNLRGNAVSADSIKGFAINLAYFLRRSCITRPCNERLERMLKVGYAGKCFPYTSGGYKGEGKLWEECKKQAKIDEFEEEEEN